MDQTKLTNLLKFTIAKFKEMGTELCAHQLAFSLLKATLESDYPGFTALADEALKTARSSSSLQERMKQQFDEPLERFLQQVSQAQTEEEVEGLLLAMPVSKLVN